MWMARVERSLLSIWTPHSDTLYTRTGFRSRVVPSVHLTPCTRGAMKPGCARVPSLRNTPQFLKGSLTLKVPTLAHADGSLRVYGDCHDGMLRQAADNTRLASPRPGRVYTVTRCNAKALIENRSCVLVLIRAVGLACLHTGAVRRRSAEPGGIRTQPSLGGRWLYAVPKQRVHAHAHAHAHASFISTTTKPLPDSATNTDSRVPNRAPLAG